jgi:hypothetical protein
MMIPAIQMKIGVRYIIAKIPSRKGSLQVGDRVMLDKFNDLLNQQAQGWLPAESFFVECKNVFVIEDLTWKIDQAVKNWRKTCQ